MSYGTGRGVLEQVLSRGDELGLGLAEREAECKRYIQAGLVAITAESYPWPWAEVNSAPLVLFAPITAGTVSVVNGSATITFTVAPPVSVAGWKFYLDLDKTVYPIVAHTAAATTATLAVGYLGTTATGQAFHLVQDEYDLAPNFLRPLQQPFMKDMQGQCPCDLIDEDELKTLFRYPGNLGTPEKVAMIGPQRVVFGPVPSSAKLMTYDYLKHPTTGYTVANELQFDDSANDVVIIRPQEDGQVLEFYALAHLLNDKGDSRARSFAEATVIKINDMKRLGMKLRRPRTWVSAQFRVSTPR